MQPFFMPVTWQTLPVSNPNGMRSNFKIKKINYEKLKRTNHTTTILRPCDDAKGAAWDK